MNVYHSTLVRALSRNLDVLYTQCKSSDNSQVCICKTGKIEYFGPIDDYPDYLVPILYEANIPSSYLQTL